LLSIGKSAQFGPNGMAIRGQCNPDSPGWQLIWFGEGKEPETIWQGAYKTCRRLQADCMGAGDIEEARNLLEKLLAVPAGNQPTDIFPSPALAVLPAPEEDETEATVSLSRKKRKKRRH
jgi:hypothetical protein